MPEQSNWTQEVVLIQTVLKNHQPEELEILPHPDEPQFVCEFCKRSWPCVIFNTAREAYNETIKGGKRGAVSRVRSTAPIRQVGTIAEHHTFRDEENLGDSGN